MQTIMREYWSAYGGVREMMTSPYFWSAVFITPLTFSLWTKPNWWDLPLQVLPNLVSFTLAGFAMFMAFGDNGFKRLLVDDGEEKGPFLPMSATFTHFIVVQTVALVVAVVAKAQPVTSLEGLWPELAVIFPAASPSRTGLRLLFWWFGFAAFLYALTSIIAATFAVFRVSRWFNTYNASRGSGEG